MDLFCDLEIYGMRIPLLTLPFLNTVKFREPFRTSTAVNRHYIKNIKSSHRRIVLQQTMHLARIYSRIIELTTNVPDQDWLSHFVDLYSYCRRPIYGNPRGDMPLSPCQQTSPENCPEKRPEKIGRRGGIDATVPMRRNECC
jgi:hypothetical protein